MPINLKDVEWEDTTPKPDNVEWEDTPAEKKSSVISQIGAGISQTAQNIGKVYPAAETAANIATSTYGVPISGLVGLAALPFGLDAAGRAIDAVQKYLIYKPQTQGGQQLTAAANYPIDKLSEAGQAAGGAIERAGYPNVGAAVDTLISASPALAQLKGSMRATGARPGAFGQAVNQGINKAVRPSVSKKEIWGQRDKYMQNARTAVDEIIQNKENLKLIDREGNERTGALPRTLEEFSQAIEQTKKAIYEEYDGLAKSADQKGAQVTMVPTIAELQGVTNNKVMQTISPETVQYANARINALSGKTFSAQETQQIIQMMNQSEKAFYANPTPEMKGKAYVDAMIANNLRAALDGEIELATGAEYAPLKKKYGALRMLETDVTKRAIVDARKNIRGLVDFSDIFSGSQLVQGVLSANPATIGSAMTAKGISGLIKYVNDPNRIVNSMFSNAERYGYIRPRKPLTITPGMVTGAMSGENDKEY